MAEPGDPMTPQPGQPGSAAIAAEPVATGQPEGPIASTPGELVVCPFLVAEGGWRLSAPDREHRCAAFIPPAPLAPDKQARLCLTPSHLGCATYLASVTARGNRLGTEPRVAERATRWGYARTTTVIEDRGGLRTVLLGLLLDRRRWPAIPAVLLVIALVTLALSGFRAGLPATAVATSSLLPSVIVTVAPVIPTETPIPTEAPSLPASAAPPSATATGAAVPSPTFRTYRVVSGDALATIARRFGVTVTAIAELNHLTNPNRLQVGQILLIPW